MEYMYPFSRVKHSMRTQVCQNQVRRKILAYRSTLPYRRPPTECPRALLDLRPMVNTLPPSSGRHI